MPALSLTLEYYKVDGPIHDRVLTDQVVEVSVGIPDDENIHQNLYHYITENYEEIDKEARKTIASREVDYESYGSDSAYRDYLDIVANDFYIESLRVEGAELFTYTAEGTYNDGGPWSENIEAVSYDEARLQAKWIMARNCGVEPDPESQSPEAWATDLFASIDDQSIASITGATPSSDEYHKVLLALVENAEAEGTTLDGLDDAKILLARHAQGDRISANQAIHYLEPVDVGFKP